MARMLLLFSHRLTDAQAEDARTALRATDFVYLPADLQACWSQVPPDLPDLTDYAVPFQSWLATKATSKDYVLIQGDFGLTYLMVQHALTNDLHPVYSTTRRQVSEAAQPDGSVRTERTFVHVGFRRYGPPAAT